MTPPAATTAEYAPIFSWETGRRRKVSLISFLAASALLHALCFYLFQIIYPPTVALLPPPARVNLITADSEEGRLLLRWIEAEDPALSSLTQRPADASTTSPPTPPHVPSYLRHEPALKQLPALRPDLRIPSAEPPGPSRCRRLRRPRRPAPSPPACASSRPPQALGAPEIPPLHFTASNEAPPVRRPIPRRHQRPRRGPFLFPRALRPAIPRSMNKRASICSSAVSLNSKIDPPP